MGYLTRIVPLGGFSGNMKTYSSHVLGAHYIVPSSMLVSNVSALEEVSNVDECSTLSSTLLCKTRPQTTCGLHSSNRNGCTVVEHNSTNDEVSFRNLSVLQRMLENLSMYVLVHTNHPTVEDSGGDYANETHVL